MNFHTSKIVYLSLSAIFLAVIFSYIYYALGGFEEIKVYKLEPINRTVFGKTLDRPSSDEYYEHGEKCRQLIANGDINGIFTIVFNLSDTTEFMGVSIETDMAEVPSDFKPREYKSGERYVIFLSMNPMIQPRPATVESLIQERAAADGNELEDFYFTLIYEDNSRSVEWWIK